MALIEVVYASSWVVFEAHDAAMRCLQRLRCGLRLDYHGVLDTVSPETCLVSGASICALSYVGERSLMRSVVRRDLMTRIQSGQIDIGILVFRRGFGVERNRFSVAGSKAWVNAWLGVWSGVPVFLDDSMDHVRSVRWLMGDSVVAMRYLKRDTLVEQLQSLRTNGTGLRGNPD